MKPALVLLLAMSLLRCGRSSPQQTHLPSLPLAQNPAGCVGRMGVWDQGDVSEDDEVEVTGVQLAPGGVPDDSPMVLTRLFSEREYRVVPDALGRYRTTIDGAEVMVRGGNVSRMRMTSTAPGLSGRFELTFLPHPGKVDLPAMKAWSDGLHVDATRPELSVSFETLSASHGITGTTFNAQLSGASGEPIAHLCGVRPSFIVNPMLLEDFAGPKLTLSAHTQLGQPREAMRMVHRSETVALGAGSLIPVSRGAACSTHLQGPCPLTDGKLEETPQLFPDEAYTQPGARDWPVEVLLPRPTVLKKAVLRGLGFASNELLLLTIEGRRDDGTWTPLGSVQGEDDYGQAFRFAVVDLEAVPAVAVTAVRLRATADGAHGFERGSRALFAAREISLFE